MASAERAGFPTARPCLKSSTAEGTVLKASGSGIKVPGVGV